MYNNFILFSSFLFLIRVNDALKLQHSMEQCKRTGPALVCDFKNIQEEITLESDFMALGSFSVSSLFVHNAASLSVKSGICVDLSFHNIGRVSFDPNGHCKDRMISLVLVDCTVDAVPRQLSRLELTRSKADMVHADMGLQKLWVSESNVGEFNAPWPIASQITLKMENSVVEKLLDLKIEAKTLLILTNVTIHHMPVQSLTIGNGGMAIISASNIKANENAITLKEGGKLTVRELDGTVHVVGSKIGLDDSSGRRPPGIPRPKVMSMDEETTKDGLPAKCSTFEIPIWIWLGPSLLALIEGVLLLFCLWKTKSKRVKYTDKKSDDYGGGGYNVYMGDDSGQAYGSSSHSSYNGGSGYPRKR